MCHFSGIKELTQNHVENPFKNYDGVKDNTLIKRDHRCYFKVSIRDLKCQDKSLKVISRGGSEYVAPMLFQIEDVYPIEDGILIKTQFNRDQIYFDINNQMNETSVFQGPQYAYMTLREHPLNDIHPLSFGGKSDMIPTNLNIIHVSYKIPFVVLYNDANFKVTFGMLKKKENLEQQDFETQGENYIRSIEAFSRNPDIPNISKSSEIRVEELFSMTSSHCPTKVYVTKSFLNSYEIVMSLFFEVSQKIQVYTCDIRQPKVWKNVNTLQNIIDVTQMQAITDNYHHSGAVKLISRSLSQKFDNQINDERSPQLRMLKKRIKNMNKDLVVLDSQGKSLSVYKGYTLIHTYDIANLLEFNQKEEANIISNSIAFKLTNPSKSKLTLLLKSGQSLRISLRLNISDYLVNSILKTFKVLLPPQLYESLYQDYIEVLSRQNLDPTLQKDQFTHLTTLIMGILQGDQFQVKPVLSQTTAQNTQLSQQSTQHSSVTQPQQQNQSKPSQTIQTKILRSSTTSFGTDSLAQRRKTQNQQYLTQNQQQQQVYRPSQITQSKLTSTQMVTRSTLQSNIQTRQAATRRVTSGSIDTTQPLSIANSQTPFVAQNRNPFQELLNSDFHNSNFSTTFGTLFPSGFQITIPQAQNQSSQEQPLSNPISISPTKSSSKPVTQKVVSSKTNKQDFQIYLNQIFDTLHLLHEDLKLNKLRDSIERPRLAKFLIRLALFINPLSKAAFVEYYFKDLKDKIDKELQEEIKKVYKDKNILKSGQEIEAVPKIFEWAKTTLMIDNLLLKVRNYKKDQGLMNYPFQLFYENTRKIVRLYEILNNSQSNSFISPLLTAASEIKIDNQSYNELMIPSLSKSFDILNIREYLMTGSLNNLHQFEKVLFCLKEENLGLDQLRKLPSLLTMPFIDIIRYAKHNQQEIQTIPQWPESLYRLIQREDILFNLKLFEQEGGTKTSQQYMDQITNVQRQASKRFALNRGLTNVFADTSAEEQKQELQRKEMESNILKTTGDFIFQCSQGNEISNKDNTMSEFFKNRFAQDTRLQEVQNLLDSSKEMIVKLDHIHNRETLTEEAFNTEKQKLLDKMFQRHLSKSVGRGALTFGTIETLPTEVLNIPKINQTGFAPMNESYMQVEFKDDAASREVLQWPEFHNGVASALRIALSFRKDMKDIGGVKQQHTRNWIMYHKPQEPKYEYGGFILAIGLLGQLDTLQSTDIYQHLKTTHEATAIGTLIGRAASKIGSMDDNDTRTICIHIPYLLPPNLSIDISLPIQSAAVIAAGLLYKGTQNRLMTEMLLAQIGRKPLSDKAIEREGYALASGIALGFVNLGIGNKMQGLSDLKLDERLIRYVEGGKIIDLPQSMLSQNFNHENVAKSQGCSSIKEGDMVNVHITSQGALVALALIHLKSNNSQIASQLQMPQSFFSLESVRPQFLLLKTLCRNLIMWDSVESTKEWICGQIPTIIRDIYENDIQTIEKKFQQKAMIQDGIDYSTISLCYVNIVAGALFSIGFKYVGTGNKQAFHLINDYTMNFFKKHKIVQSNKDAIGMVHNNFTKNQIDKNTVETCLCVCAFAMSMIMAGSGDVDCFRALRVIRKRLEHDMNYGYNMAINMSMGFLFLGSGAFTFNRDDLSIASLLCALYPVFPTNPNDNRYHLQALRHFYVLAIESRLLQCKDIDTGNYENIEMLVTLEGNNAQGQLEIKTQKIKTPEILNGVIRSIEINDEKYHSINIDMFGYGQIQNDRNTTSQEQSKKGCFGLQKVIYVKKKPASTITDISQKSQIVAQNDNDVISDDSALKALQEQHYSNDIFEQARRILPKMKLISDPTILKYCQYFADVNAFDFLNFNEIEDVLLSQHRDPLGQLAPNDFFKIQDQYEQIKEIYGSKLMPETVMQKLKLLNCMHECFFNDQLESITQRTQFVNPGQSTEQKQIETAYYKFTSNHHQLKNGQKVEPTTSQDYQSLQTKAMLMSENFTDYLLKQEYEYSLSVYTLALCKLVADQILEQLIKVGESDLVQRYKEAVEMNHKLEEGPLLEIQQSILMSIQHLTGDEDHQLLEKVIVPTIMRF